MNYVLRAVARTHKKLGVGGAHELLMCRLDCSRLLHDDCYEPMLRDLLLDLWDWATEEKVAP